MNKDKAQQLLDLSDWTQIPNSGLTDDCILKFRSYRASLRVIRKTEPSNPTVPSAPTEEWK